jgi:hypothetical protein
MTFDELEVGKEYVACNSVRRVIGKAANEVATEAVTGALAGCGEPFLTYQRRYDFSDWRPYVPPPAPVVRYVFARIAPNYCGEPYCGVFRTEHEATGDSHRIGPVISVELPIDPNMLARVRDGAK